MARKGTGLEFVVVGVVLAKAGIGLGINNKLASQ